MISDTSKTGEKYYYYTRQKRKTKKTCTTKPIKKEWLEDVVIQATKENLPTDKTIDFISDCIIELQEKATDTTALDSINNQIKEVEKSIKNVMSAIEAGIITHTTKERLLELETRQAKLQSQKRIINNRQIIFIQNSIFL